MRPNRREELVEKATATFYRNGFQATGMDQLAAETGISKTAIYKHFATKDDLVIATLRLRDSHIRGWLFNRMEQLATEPAGQLLAMFDALQEWFDTPEFHGCMFIKACAEYQAPDHPVRIVALTHVERITARLEELARAAGYACPADFARQLTLLQQGAVIMASMGMGKRPAFDAKVAAAGLLARQL